MSPLHHPPRTALVAGAVGALLLAAPGTALADGRQGAADHGHHGHGRFAVTQVNLVSDLASTGASVVDRDVVNPWGLALGPTTPLWSANNGTDTATLYSSAPGSTTAATVGAVRVTFPDTPELPTGQVFNGTDGFRLTAANTSSARFIFSTLTGHIEAWSPLVDPLKGNAETRATVPGAAYTGLALATAKNGPQLYAANFARGTVDVFDTNFTLQRPSMRMFHDPRVPAGYAPFGIAALKGKIFVAYAQVDPLTHRNAAGRGLGIVDEYSTSGRLLARVARGHSLNAPWGMEFAPPSWGRLAGALLVGNFGDGRINVITSERHGRDDHHDGDRARFRITGLLHNSATGRVLVIPGLWALLRGTASTGGTDSIFFSAGIDNERHGLIGVLRRP